MQVAGYVLAVDIKIQM